LRRALAGLPHDVLAEGTYAWVSRPTYEAQGEVETVTDLEVERVLRCEQEAMRRIAVKSCAYVHEPHTHHIDGHIVIHYS
jgi:hypothetical protein